MIFSKYLTLKKDASKEEYSVFTIIKNLAWKG